MQTKYLTILISDIEGFTDKTSHLTRQELGRLLRLQDQLVRPIIIRFNGKVIKTIGDAYLVTFTSPTNAVLCGMHIQEILAQHNKNSHPKARLHMRIAINSGEVNVIDQDVYGTPVNIAARLQALTQPGKVFLTQATYTAINPIEAEAMYLGPTHLKGISESIKVYVAVSSPTKKFFWLKLFAPFYFLNRLLLPAHAIGGVSYKLRFTLLFIIGAFTLSTIAFAQNLQISKNDVLSQSNSEVQAQLNSEEVLPQATTKPVNTKFSTVAPTISTTQATTKSEQVPVTNVTHYVTYTTVTTTSPSATPRPTVSPEASVSPSPSPAPSSTPQTTESPSPGGSQMTTNTSDTTTSGETEE